MKFSIRNFIKKFSWKVEKERTNSNPLYEDLTAENNVKNNHYLEALEWSLNNEKIKNVALSGPYGSGKSSIINSFEQLYKKNYNFLNISLATFS
ncbi:P-loop NTPase fold protein, partial [Niallia circulans]